MTAGSPDACLIPRLTMSPSSLCPPHPETDPQSSSEGTALSLEEHVRHAVTDLPASLWRSACDAARSEPPFLSQVPSFVWEGPPNLKSLV